MIYIDLLGSDVFLVGLKYHLNINMLSMLASSAFTMKFYKPATGGGGSLTYEQFTYDASNYSAGYNNPDGADSSYRLVITSGAAQAIINELTTSSLPGKTTTLYFKTMVTNANAADGASLFMLSANVGSYDNTSLLTMQRNNAAGTQFNFVIGSNGVNYKETTLTGFPGYNHYTHVFLVIRATNELVAYVYDDTETQIHTSTTTIVSSVFGNDFDRNMVNGRPAGPSGNGRKQTVKDMGLWPGEITVAEMEAVVAANPN
jgi:hypothetical protein